MIKKELRFLFCGRVDKKKRLNDMPKFEIRQRIVDVSNTLAAADNSPAFVPSGNGIQFFVGFLFFEEDAYRHIQPLGDLGQCRNRRRALVVFDSGEQRLGKACALT